MRDRLEALQNSGLAEINGVLCKIKLLTGTLNLRMYIQPT